MPILDMITPPGALPLDVAEARLHVRQDGTFDDVKLKALLSAAASFAMTETKRAIVASRWRLTLDGFPGPSLVGVPWGQTYSVPDHAILLERSPLIALETIEYLDMGGTWQTMAATDYVMTPGSTPRITPPFGRIWPIPMPQVGSVRVTFLSGFAAAMRADVSTNSVQLINWAPLAVGASLRVSNSGGALPAPLQSDTDYYVQAVVAPGKYALAATPSGAAITLADAGTGTHYAGTQIGTEPAGQIPEGLKAWMSCRLDSLYEHRGETAVVKGAFTPLPWIDALLDPYRVWMP